MYAEAVNTVSLDHSVFAFGGGDSKVEGGFATFNVVEIQQADARIANSFFEQNANGLSSPAGDQIGRGTNSNAVIFVRGSEAVIYANTIINNDGNAISIDANSLNAQVCHGLRSSNSRRVSAGAWVG